MRRDFSARLTISAAVGCLALLALASHADDFAVAAGAGGGESVAFTAAGANSVRLVVDSVSAATAGSDYDLSATITP